MSVPEELPPGPYNIIVTSPLGSGHVYIADANGRKIASMWGKPQEKMALAKMIITTRGE